MLQDNTNGYLVQSTNKYYLKIQVMPTTYEMNKCREILSRIDEHIPVRGYVNDVQALLKKRGLKVPSRYKIQNVRAGRVYDLDIVKALEEVSKPRDEDDNPITPKEFKSGHQTGLQFEPATK